MPRTGKLQEILNSDAMQYAGSGVLNTSKLTIEAIPYDGRDYSVAITLPPLSVVIFKIV